MQPQEPIAGAPAGLPRVGSAVPLLIGRILRAPGTTSDAVLILANALREAAAEAIAADDHAMGAELTAHAQALEPVAGYFAARPSPGGFVISGGRIRYDGFVG